MPTAPNHRVTRSSTLCFFAGVLVMLGFNTLRGSDAQPTQTPPPHHVYELRMYHAKEGKMDALKARFGDHTDALFQKHNMKSIGYFSPEDAKSAQELFIYVLEHPSREAAAANWKSFQDDPEWKNVRDKSEANGKLVEKVESVFMSATDYSAMK